MVKRRHRKRTRNGKTKTRKDKSGRPLFGRTTFGIASRIAIRKINYKGNKPLAVAEFILNSKPISSRRKITLLRMLRQKRRLKSEEREYINQKIKEIKDSLDH